MKRLVKVLLGGFILFGGTIVSAQSHIELISENITCNNCDAVTLNGAYSYNYVVANTGSSDLLISYKENDAGIWVINSGFNHHVMVIDDEFPTNIAQYDYLSDPLDLLQIKLYKGPQETNQIKVGDTVEVRVTDVALNLRYTEGNNTIVVWPENLSYNGTTEQDSLKFVSGVNALINVNSIEPENLVSVYPNPVHDVVNIRLSSEMNMNIGKMEIVDATGKVVKMMSNYYSEIKVDDLTSGFYQIRFYLDNQTAFTKPLVISRK